MWLGIFTFLFPTEESKISPENLFHHAIFLINNKEFNKAISQLNLILTMLQEQFESEEITLVEYEGKKARIYSEMANIYMLLQDHNKAVDIIIETMKSCFKAEILPSNPTIIELSLKLALIYVAQKNYTDADIGFKFCLENCKLEINKKDCDEEEAKNLEALLGMIYNYYSKFLYGISKYNQAMDNVIKSIEQALKVYEKTHPNFIHLINDQAVIYLALKHYDNARMKFQEAIDICLSCPKDDAVEILPSIYVNFGNLFIETGDVERAEEMCGNSRKYWHSIYKDETTDHSLKNQIDDCFFRLAGLKSMERED